MPLISAFSFSSISSVRTPAAFNCVAEPRHAVLGALVGQLLLGAVLGLLVVGRVGRQSLDLGLDEGRAIAGACPFDRIACRDVAGQHVIPIDDNAGDAIAGRAVGDVRHRDLARERAR